MTPRSWLLVAADDEETLHRALESEADALIFDLEDAVVPDRKQHARELLRDVLRTSSGTGPQRWVRINQLESEFYGADLACCEELDLTGLVLPKAERGEQVRRLAADVMESGWQLHAMVGETPASLFHLGSFQESSAELVAMSWGIDDLTVGLGATSKFDHDGQLSFTHRMARSLCLAAAKAAGVQAVDAVHRDVTDEQRLVRETEAARREGFTGKLAVSVSQVSVINKAFTPTGDEVAAARAIVDAFEAQPNRGVLNVGARMVDRTRLMQARGVIQRAEATGD
jgi:citrate lyase subunit beta / citryl-CoA lyase